MRALHLPASGETPQLSELPIPEVTEGTVLVRVRAAGLNAIDNAVVNGYLEGMVPHEYPVTLGRDAAGVVEAVGAGVDHVKVGDEVVGHMLPVELIKQGTLAEFALFPASTVAIKPAGVDFVAASAVPLAGAAASAAIDVIDPQPGQSVLVNGASGGVGSYVVQLLASKGVTVIGTATGADLDRVKGLGAATVLDFATGDLVAQVKALYPDGVDALIDLASLSADTAPLDAVKTGGKVSSTTQAADPEALAAKGLSGSTVFAMPVKETVSVLLDHVANGTIRIDVSTVLPLEEALDGLGTIAAGKATGKIVVEIN